MPVGTVYVAVSGPELGAPVVEECRFGGSREQIRRASVRAVLLLLERLCG
jgi:nicotinamide mononucleotide (NMN) deamidase PncC